MRKRKRRRRLERRLGWRFRWRFTTCLEWRRNWICVDWKVRWSSTWTCGRGGEFQLIFLTRFSLSIQEESSSLLISERMSWNSLIELSYPHFLAFLHINHHPMQAGRKIPLFALPFTFIIKYVCCCYNMNGVYIHMFFFNPISFTCYHFTIVIVIIIALSFNLTILLSGISFLCLFTNCYFEGAFLL